MIRSFVGHSVSDAAGNILTMDEAACDYLHRPRREIIGYNFAEFTHPGDLAANILRVRGLEVGEKPLLIRKRYTRPGAKSLLTDVHVSRLNVGNGKEGLVGSLFMVDPAHIATEAIALRMAAADALSALRRRVEDFGSAMFADQAWHILLELYLAEADGRAVRTFELVERINQPLNTTIRWLKSLEQAGLVAPSIDGDVGLQLSDKGFTKIECQLAARAPVTMSVNSRR